MNAMMWLYACTLTTFQICYVTPDYETLAEVRERVTEVAPHLTRYDDMEPANFFKLAEKLAKVS